MDDDLVAFLRARLDEDEAIAWAAASSVGTVWRVVLNFRDDKKLAPFLARHDPARLLHEVEAGRKLLDAYEAAGRDTGWGTRWESDYFQGLNYAVRCRATVHRDHPDWRPEWAPCDNRPPTGTRPA